MFTSRHLQHVATAAEGCLALPVPDITWFQFKFALCLDVARGRRERDHQPHHVPQGQDEDQALQCEEEDQVQVKHPSPPLPPHHLSYHPLPHANPCSAPPPSLRSLFYCGQLCHPSFKGNDALKCCRPWPSSSLDNRHRRSAFFLHRRTPHGATSSWPAKSPLLQGHHCSCQATVSPSTRSLASLALAAPTAEVATALNPRSCSCGKPPPLGYSHALPSPLPTPSPPLLPLSPRRRRSCSRRLVELRLVKCDRRRCLRLSRVSLLWHLN